jgi:oxygen-independent coproporphyrinogen III oxidase
MPYLKDPPMHISPELIEKYNVPVPRYTSYPPANHFSNEFKSADHLQLIDASNNAKPAQLAFYVHIPFCKKICHYCGCNSCALGSANMVEPYIEALKEEIKMVSENIDTTRKLSQIHYGGGTPNAVDVRYLKDINTLFLQKFKCIEKPEIAIECNPAYLDMDYIYSLKEAGFNRFSLGIQDFDNKVLKMVNREPSAFPVETLIHYLKEGNENFGVNLDFIYGLPGQTVESFVQTILKAIAIRPDRMVTFSYAHVPWLKKNQIILEKRGLPEAGEKMKMFLAAYEVLTKSGYKHIGLDHYVLPGDELYKALNNNQLHRNFQGYCTRETTGQVYAFGVSSISQLEGGYAQNTKSLSTYIKSIKNGNLATEKGHKLSDEQKITRAIITHLMCNKRIHWQQLSDELGLAPSTLQSHVNLGNKLLDEFVSDRLISISDETIEVSETGSLFIRNIAAALDKSFDQQINTYSRSV